MGKKRASGKTGEFTDHTYTQQCLARIRAVHKAVSSEEGNLDQQTIAELLREEANLFREIVPSYHITSKDSDRKISKAAAAVEDLEEQILASYRKFLDIILSLASSDKREGVALGLECIAILTPVAAEFNFGPQLLNACVRGCAGPLIPAGMCMSALEDLFRKDAVGEVTAVALQMILNIVKELKDRTPVKLVGTLLTINVTAIDIDLSTEEAEARKKGEMKRRVTEQARKTRKQRAADFSKKKKGAHKREADELDVKVADALSKGDAMVRPDVIKKANVLVANRLISIYLRLLEAAANANAQAEREAIDQGFDVTGVIIGGGISATPTAAYRGDLLAATLHGVGNFAHILDHTHCELLFRALTAILESRTLPPLVRITAASTFGALMRRSGALDAAVAQKLSATARLADPSIGAAANSGVAVGIGGAHDALFALMPDALAPPNAIDVASMPAGAHPSARRIRCAALLRAVETLMVSGLSAAPRKQAALARKLLMSCINETPSVQLPILSMLHRIALRNESVGNVVGGFRRDKDPWTEPPVGGGGAAVAKNVMEANRPDDVIDQRPALAWEWAALARSVHPVVASVVGGATRPHTQYISGGAGNPPAAAAALAQDLLAGSPEVLLRAFDTSHGGFNPLPLPVTETPAYKAMEARQAGVFGVKKDDQQGGDKPLAGAAAHRAAANAANGAGGEASWNRPSVAAAMASLAPAPAKRGRDGPGWVGPGGKRPRK